MRVIDLVTHQSIYSDAGIDGYWSPDGTHLVYAARRGAEFYPVIWNRASGKLSVEVISNSLGDHYSLGEDAASGVPLTMRG